MLGRQSWGVGLISLPASATKNLYMLNIVLVIGLLSGLTAVAGLSYALGAFIGGILISETIATTPRYAACRTVSPYFSGFLFYVAGRFGRPGLFARQLAESSGGGSGFAGGQRATNLLLLSLDGRPCQNISIYGVVVVRCWRVWFCVAHLSGSQRISFRRYFSIVVIGQFARPH